MTKRLVPAMDATTTVCQRWDPRDPVADDRSTIFIVIGEGVRLPGSGDAGLVMIERSQIANCRSCERLRKNRPLDLCDG